MIIVTGAAGFIGSCLIGKLNAERYLDVVAVDDFSRKDKINNLKDKTITEHIHRDKFHQWLKKNHRLVQFVFHLGARTDTTETDSKIFDALNLNYSKQVWLLCAEMGLPMVYASSAATYGDGSHGYDDAQERIALLKPMNPYGMSKQQFDVWALSQPKKPYFWAGLKFFNVYGPNEYHKGRMASVIFHAFHQIVETGKVKLFRSHKSNYPDGGQLRDFIYVKDIVEVCFFLMQQRKYSGIYNLGTGKARTFNDLATSVFNSLDRPVSIEFIDIPADIRDTYQYQTEAKMKKLRSIGYDRKFCSLEEGIDDYIKNYLDHTRYY
ncbi:MAG: ADP-glyceromanno-heptose 6-epimerase [Bacteroidia bacterium]|nr:ADP-glyceromanno-heptose 6-epimerase [Bacteroidia bacterium]MCZ2278458.1 ADP-glyceromanno-heptose 6-epimerase [Bacteroidia bacterium]